jgi:hypothetical protein
MAAVETRKAMCTKVYSPLFDEIFLPLFPHHSKKKPIVIPSPYQKTRPWNNTGIRAQG